MTAGADRVAQLADDPAQDLVAHRPLDHDGSSSVSVQSAVTITTIELKMGRCARTVQLGTRHPGHLLCGHDRHGQGAHLAEPMNGIIPSMARVTR